MHLFLKPKEGKTVCETQLNPTQGHSVVNICKNVKHFSFYIGVVVVLK